MSSKREQSTTMITLSKKPCSFDIPFLMLSTNLFAQWTLWFNLYCAVYCNGRPRPHGTRLPDSAIQSRYRDKREMRQFKLLTTENPLEECSPVREHESHEKKRKHRAVLPILSGSRKQPKYLQEIILYYRASNVIHDMPHPLTLNMC